MHLAMQVVLRAIQDFHDIFVVRHDTANVMAPIIVEKTRMAALRACSRSGASPASVTKLPRSSVAAALALSGGGNLAPQRGEGADGRRGVAVGLGEVAVDYGVEATLRDPPTEARDRLVSRRGEGFRARCSLLRKCL